MSLRPYLMTLSWLVLVTAMSLLPASALPSTTAFKGMDKLIHAYMYGQFVILLVITFHKQHDFDQVKHAPRSIALAIATAYGLLMELLQHNLIPGRTFDFLDILANIGGGLLGLLAFRLIYRR